MRFSLFLAIAAAVASVACASAARAPSASDEMHIGTQAAQRGYWQEALFRFARARVQDPSNAEILNNQAVALEALGRYDEALAVYKQALQLAPKNTVIRKNYARFAEFFTSYARGVRPKGLADASH